MTEKLFQDRLIKTIYSDIREHVGIAFKLITSPRMSALVASLVYDMPGAKRITGGEDFVKELGINLEECAEPEALTSSRAVFERKIRYWETRPMNPDERVAVSPADSRVVLGSFRTEHSLFLKEKFFTFSELLGSDKDHWKQAFHEGDYAIFRLTPDKYHWNHVPVSGIVRDFYEIEGSCHSCNPAAVIAEVTPYSKNRRHVTIIDTDVDGGSGMGLVAMLEVAALMIGGIEQRYSETHYDYPFKPSPGLFVKRGQVKSLYHPGSSVDILIFQKNRIAFSDDLVANSLRTDVVSRFSVPFGRPLVETDILLRSDIGRAI